MKNFNYKGHSLNIGELPEFHISKIIEEKWIARINQIVEHKKPKSSKLDKLIEMTEELGLYEYF